jgi:hypothetical protein
MVPPRSTARPEYAHIVPMSDDATCLQLVRHAGEERREVREDAAEAVLTEDEGTGGDCAKASAGTRLDVAAMTASVPTAARNVGRLIGAD